MTAPDSPPSAAAADAAMLAASKPKRVRTGCLTCRERHLKCDEGLPNCQNCRKSAKTCKRGMKLNFHWLDVKDPAILPPTANWSVQFQDESRLIASEYKGGLGQYSQIKQNIIPPREPGLEFQMAIDPNISMHDNPPPILQPGVSGLYPENGGINKHEQNSREIAHHHHSHTNNNDVSYLPAAPPTSYGNQEPILTPPPNTEYLSDPEEVLLLQVFVEEVGLWMDSLDQEKHFSRLLPFSALQEPMLLNAFLACGARHLRLVNPLYHEDKALYYYDTATTQLLQALQNPDRDTVVCATAAVILNVYEIMSERALLRMNHIAGARALIKECGWSARSGGVGSACFWLNIAMELLSCLHFNWQTAWEPDLWGVDMDFSRGREPGGEDIWAHRIVYVTAKIANFRATIPRFQEASPLGEHMKRQARYAEWQKLRDLCDSWNNSVPRTMHPMGLLFPHQSPSKSLFPEVWLLKRTAITARLFYHTALCLLAQTNPLVPSSAPDMSSLLLEHAHQICGIVAHVKDRGVATVSLRSLAIAAEALVERGEQEEVMRMFAKIGKEAGWNVAFLDKELPEKWGWNAQPDEQLMLREHDSPSSHFLQGAGAHGGAAGGGMPPPPLPAGLGQGQGQAGQQSQPQQQQPTAPPAMKGGILNPLLAKADFSLPNHPYQAYYQPPRAQDTQGQGQGQGQGQYGNHYY